MEASDWLNSNLAPKRSFLIGAFEFSESKASISNRQLLVESAHIVPPLDLDTKEAVAVPNDGQLARAT